MEKKIWTPFFLININTSSSCLKHTYINPSFSSLKHVSLVSSARLWFSPRESIIISERIPSEELGRESVNGRPFSVSVCQSVEGRSSSPGNTKKLLEQTETTATNNVPLLNILGLRSMRSIYISESFYIRSSIIEI